ncbi:MAG: alpha/beta fold hydrolase [Bacteroidales bacterium]
MKLHHTRLGSGHPLLILHGLYGSGENWLTIARALAGLTEVFLPDLRNHGASPHAEQMDYASMAADVLELMDDLDIPKAVLLGHSMGGKTAMRFALENPGRVSRLIIADISPRNYLGGQQDDLHLKQHQLILSALEKVDPGLAGSIGDLDRMLSEGIPNRRLRQFLLKNLSKSDAGLYEWKLNRQAIRQNLATLAGSIGDDLISGPPQKSFPVLFIRGEQSPYITEADYGIIRKLFPLAQINTIKEAGHWLHAEQPDLFIGMVRKFLLET